jgi:hypothetical protein
LHVADHLSIKPRMSEVVPGKHPPHQQHNATYITQQTTTYI